MTTAFKRKLLLFLILFGAAFVLIAASLPRLELKPGIPPPYLMNGEINLAIGAGQQTEKYAVSAFFINLLLVMLAAMLIWLVYKGIQGARWKELWREVLRSAAIFVGVVGLAAIALSLLPTSGDLVVEEAMVIPTPPAVVTAPLGPPPPVLTWLVGALLAASAALLAYWFLRPRQSPDLALTRLGEEAEKARQALLTGVSLREVILQCYRQMSSVLQEENGIERQAYMTTGEFERLLAAEGFPAGPVHQLTRLFDAVRYGRWQPGLNDDQKAIDCLEAIIRHSRETRNEDGARQEPGKAGEHA